MHELSIATAILEHCEALRPPGGRPVAAVRVAVGELASVDPALLALAWEAVREGVLAGARLEVDWRAARQHCARCGEVAERQPGTWLRVCPTCREPLRVEGGDDLDLLGLDLEDPAGAETSPC